MSNVTGPGRLANQIIRNKALSVLAEKFDLEITYQNYDIIHNRLGINLYVGKNKYTSDIQITDSNYRQYWKNIETISSNIQCSSGGYQGSDIKENIQELMTLEKESVIAKNPFRDRYKNNNDLFIHIRLGDSVRQCPPIDYFEKCINQLQYDKIYIGSDELKHSLIVELCKKYPTKISLVEKDLIETIQFGSTCKNVIISQGTYSAIIGFLSFYSDVFYPDKAYLEKGTTCNYWWIESESWLKIEP